MSLNIHLTPQAVSHITAKGGVATVYMDSATCGGG